MFHPDKLRSASGQIAQTPVSYTHLQLSIGVVLVDFHEQPFEVYNPLLIPGKLLLQDGQDVYKRQPLLCIHFADQIDHFDGADRAVIALVSGFRCV